MAGIGRNLKKQGVIMTLLSLVLMNIGCEEQIDPANIPSEGGKMVEVSLNIGFADEADGYTIASKSDASSNKGAFSYELQPSVVTKGDATIKPDKLYNLEIQQYDQSGTRIGGITKVEAEREIGSTIALTLKANSDCQLVIVAWGEGNTKNSLGTSSLANVQKLSLDATSISNLNPETQSDMNKMPYVLHLEHVDATTSTIQSLEGEDVRLLLKRLAARLTLNWKYSYSGYTLNQILLESIPTNYNVVPNPDKTDKTYPSLLDQFTTIKIEPSSLTPDLSEQYTYSCWVPANVRGSNSAATSQNYRIKSNAPTGSSYASFIAGNNTDAKKKLNYRVYLGGSSSFDFNINSNTNYNYTVRFTHTDLPVNDRRVTIIDPIPASEMNNNFVPTANCFMVAPGGAFCFNPYKFNQKGVTIDNTTLQGSEWCNVVSGTINTPIKSVKVLWQTKENGDIGDPVLGVVTSASDHTNIVDLKDFNDLEKARIYCRVAPNTSGGSGVIAAYTGEDGGGEILWSWHIWVTDYAPDANANESVDDPKKRVQKYIYGGKTQYPMMDRNLGAQAGYTDVPDGDLAKSKANGFHYQCGRKDPFPSTYSASIDGNQLAINSDKLTPGMLNYYQPDGISYFIRTTADTDAKSLREAFKNPTTTFANMETSGWCTGIIDNNLWEDKSHNLKTVHDPCPAGWRVASKINYYPLFTNTSYQGGGNVAAKETMNIKNSLKLSTDGGAVIFFEQTSSGKSTYIRLTGYQPNASSFDYIGGMTNLWCREAETGKHGYALTISPNGLNKDAYNIANNWAFRDSHPLRCIQDR